MRILNIIIMLNKYNNMLYRLVEHYDPFFDFNSSDSLQDEKKECQESNELKECFICLDTNDVYQTTIELKNQLIYIKTCSCDGFIHNSCLIRWFKLHSSCPICRTQMMSIPTFAEKIMKNPIVYLICINSTRVYENVICINYYLYYIRHISVLIGFFIFFSLSLEIVSRVLENGNYHYKYQYQYQNETCII